MAVGKCFSSCCREFKIRVNVLAVHLDKINLTIAKRWPVCLIFGCVY